MLTSSSNNIRHMCVIELHKKSSGIEHLVIYTYSKQTWKTKVVENFNGIILIEEI